MQKNPFLVDVPVKINIWIRPECQRVQFEVLKQARPSVLFLISDGGRNEQERAVIAANRKIFDEEIDWACTVYKLYEEQNLGLYTIGRKARDLIWSKVDRCIFLEDDSIPSVSFFQYCADLLEYYKDDERISVICGYNHLGVSENVNSDYFFSKQGAIWGNATWKRTAEQFNDFEYGKDPYVMNLLKEQTKRNKTFWKRVSAYAKQELYEGHVAALEFFYEFSVYGRNQLQIVPKYNMISNIGCSKDAAHGDSLNMLPRGVRKTFFTKTYELAFPLKHAKYIIADAEYEKKRNRIMAYNVPVVLFWRKLERLFYKVMAGDFRYIRQKVKKKRETEK
ncbi:MAG TPA: hypothetical protein PK629_06500 [Oscillospiraceae bacterium]|nr:hypothetical protein [Oscillospiraceae bacterium]HPF55248.1 hypothetical protein [Clostridiales bacterium]HPK36026.1 hypothetical protein [Oscillospiraceae bacterium]HPR76321.1 hypothetical protein [Oscillospiraceae bacterium]